MQITLSVESKQDNLTRGAGPAPATSRPAKGWRRAILLRVQAAWFALKGSANAGATPKPEEQPKSQAPPHECVSCSETLAWSLRLLALEAEIRYRAPHSRTARDLAEARKMMLLEHGFGGLPIDAPVEWTPAQIQRLIDGPWVH